MRKRQICDQLRLLLKVDMHFTGEQNPEQSSVPTKYLFKVNKGPAQGLAWSPSEETVEMKVT